MLLRAAFVDESYGYLQGVTTQLRAEAHSQPTTQASPSWPHKICFPPHRAGRTISAFRAQDDGYEGYHRAIKLNPCTTEPIKLSHLSSCTTELII